MLCITTKGLYEGHSAIYNRAEMPGLNGALRLRHIDNTDGESTTLIGEEAYSLARQLVDHSEEKSVPVSNVWGSGGSKRHRRIEWAPKHIGLDKNL